MARQNASSAIRHSLKHEGGYVNNPNDKGGPTNRGITLATFRRHVKRGGTIADLKALTEAQAIEVYKRQYWDRVMGDELPSGIDYAVADYAVNSGPSRAAKALQRILGVTVDGKIGPATLKAAHASDHRDVIRKICAERLAFMKRIRGGKDWTHFGRGWQRRVDEVLAVSLGLAGDGFVRPDVEPAQPTPKQPVASGWLAALVTRFTSFTKGR